MAPGLAPASEPAASAGPSPIVMIQAPRNLRDFLMSSAAAALLVVGLLSLPDLLGRGADGAAPTAIAASAPTFAPAETLVAVAPAAVVGTPRAQELLPVTNVLRLPGGYTFDVVETDTATQTVVSELPAELEGSIQVGDVLLVYAPTGETLATATALREILQREFANGISAYSFVVRRGDSTVLAEFRLGVAG